MNPRFLYIFLDEVGNFDFSSVGAWLVDAILAGLEAVESWSAGRWARAPHFR